NSLIQFFSNNLGGVEYLRAMPYQLARADGGAFDMAIIEIVERNLPLLVDAAPAIPAPLRGAGEMAPLLARARETAGAESAAGAAAPAAPAAADIAGGAGGARGAGAAMAAGGAGAAMAARGAEEAGEAYAAGAAGVSPERATGGPAGVAAWLGAPGAGGAQGAYAHIYGFFSPDFLSSFGETRIYAIFERAGAESDGADGIYAFEAYPILEADALGAGADAGAGTKAELGDAAAQFGDAGLTLGAAAAAGERGATPADCGFSLRLDDSPMPAGNYRLSLLLCGEDGSAARSGSFMEYTKSGEPQG
ncbi:MAG: hypothetical protein LBL83_09130, partial [Clostridiales bacterium]|nr:hypothetical protein [Clostridiales bacterium]